MSTNMMNLTVSNNNMMTLSVPSTDITVGGGDDALFAMMEVLASTSNTGEKDQLMLGKIYATAQFLSQLAETLEKIGSATNIQSFLKTYLAENGDGKGPDSASILALLNYTMKTANADNSVVNALNADIAKCQEKMASFAASHPTSYKACWDSLPLAYRILEPIAAAITAGAMALSNAKAVGDYDARMGNQIKNDGHKIGPALEAATLDMNRISSNMSIVGQKDTALTEAQMKLDAREVNASLDIISAYSNICGSNNPNAPKFSN